MIADELDVSDGLLKFERVAFLASEVAHVAQIGRHGRRRWRRRGRRRRRRQIIEIDDLAEELRSVVDPTRPSPAVVRVESTIGDILLNDVIQTPQVDYTHSFFQQNDLQQQSAYDPINLDFSLPRQGRALISYLEKNRIESHATTADGSEENNKVSRADADAALNIFSNPLLLLWS